MTTVADVDLSTWNRYPTSPRLRGSNPFGLLTATSLTRHAITWTFSESVTYGQYVNGDYWVLDEGAGITVNSVSPTPTGTGASYRNGSQVNPAVDDAHGLSGDANGFDELLAETYPLSLSGGDSLLSAKSSNVTGVDVTGTSISSSVARLSDCSVLTIVSSTPSANAFRPCYVNGTKTEYLTTDLDTSLLKNISLTSKPDASYLTTSARWFNRPWIDHFSGWQARFTHPLNNIPNYGREIGSVISQAAVLLNLDYTATEKQELLYDFIQVGIDIYGMTEIGRTWGADGGHENGRKSALLFAGLLLDSAPMKAALGTATWSEDTQCYVGATASLNAGQSFVSYWGTLYGATGYYEAGCTGTGSKTRAPIALDDDACEDYRNCCTSHTWVGQAIAVKVMEQEVLWNDEKFFQYVDRWMDYGLDARVADGGVFLADTAAATWIEDLFDQERGNY